MVLALLLSVAGCRCGEHEPSAGQAAGAPKVPATVAAPAPTAPAAIEVEPLPAGTDERAYLASTGAVPAWTAVLDRGRLLARRGERGAVWGRIELEADGTLWLLDQTEGAAGLGIRLAGAGHVKLVADPGRRVVAWGAWGVVGERRWVWRAQRLVALAAREQADVHRAPPLPRSLVTDLPAAPEDAVVPSRRQKPGAILFAVIAAPVKPGDGWTIADQAKGPPTAVLLLPGEAPVYGGLDYLSPDERWPLAPGKWYAVPVSVPARPPRPGELPVLRARQPPARIPAPAPPPPPPNGKRR